MEKFINNLKIFHHKLDFNILYVLLAAFIFRLFLANFGTLQLDYGTFVAWGNSLVESGFKNFYSGWSDYLPGYLYILWFLGKLGVLVPPLQTLIYKMPAILADLGTGYLIYRIAVERKSKHGILFTVLYIFNPAIFANSTLWGQVDSLTAFFSLLSIYLFPKNLLLSALSLSIGTLIKPQAAFVLPAVLYMFLRYKKDILGFVNYALTGLFVFIIAFLPFQNQPSLYQFILTRLATSAGQYPYGSVNAFSFWGLYGFWKPDTISFWIGLGISLFIICISLVYVFINKQKEKQYLIAGVSLLTTYLFLTRMHERHLLPILPFILLSVLETPSLIIVYASLSLTYLANLSYAYYWITDNFKEIFNRFLIVIFIVINLLSLALTFLLTIYKKLNSKLVTIWQKNVAYFSKKSKIIENQKYFIGKNLPDKTLRILLSGVILFTLVTRLYSLHLPEKEYFDEVYHAFTARLIINGDPKAWEWWNPHPEGFAYEWTHPPLAKLGMAIGISIFGENAFGWRVVQALLGVGSVYLVYLLASTLFKDKLVGILAAFVLSLDGLFLVMNRIGMNDTYLVFFVLLSLYLYIKDKYLFSSITYGLALSSKWSAIYAVPIFLAAHFVLKKKIKTDYIWFFFVPVLVYVASYSVMFATGHTWAQFIEVQKQMWWYHTNLVAEHPYTSPAWTWPLLLRPIYLYNGPETGGMVSRIYAFGNPLVFWFGLFSIILSFSLAFREKIKKLAFIVFAYLILFVPWIVSPRIMFLYHYLPSLPFLAIASGFVLRRFPKIIPLFFGSALIVFIYFYPHWTGLQIPEKLDISYYWFNSWR